MNTSRMSSRPDVVADEFQVDPLRPHAWPAADGRDGLGAAPVGHGRAAAEREAGAEETERGKQA